MTATNHVLTGSVLVAATVTHVPLWLILPGAFFLHFILDSLPHFGQRDNPGAAMARLKWVLPVDASVALIILLTIIVARPEHWLPIIAGGILCASPDLWSFTRFKRFLKSGNTAYNKDWFAQFHHRIQWGERLWGAWIELAWFLSFGYILITKL